MAQTCNCSKTKFLDNKGTKENQMTKGIKSLLKARNGPQHIQRQLQKL